MAFLRMAAFGLVLTGLAVVGGSAVAAETDPVARFYGHFAGSAIATQKFPKSFGKLSNRDLDVTIRRGKDGGFSISWGTVFRERNPKLSRKREVTMHFRRTAKAHVWRAKRSGDPLADLPLIWARLDGKALLVYIFGLKASGSSSMAIYRRTVTKDVMTLEFERREDGKVVRWVKGRLKRQGKK